MAAPKPMAKLTVRPYRNFLTPALHERFVKAATVTFGVCLLVGPVMSHIERSWFLGPIRAILRASVLFVPCLLFWIARLVNMHFGSELSNSPFHTFLHYISTTRRAQTYAWMIAATRLYAEIYMAYSSPDAHYSWVEEGKAWERSKVNERYIFIGFMFVWLGLAKATWHIYCDRDKLPLAIIKYKTQSEPKDLRSAPVHQPSALAGLRTAVLKPLQSGLSNSSGGSAPAWKYLQCVLWDSLYMTGFTVVSGTVAYATLFRHPLWFIQHQFLQYFYGMFYTLQKETHPGPYPGLLDLIARSTWQCALCNILLECASTAFTVYTAQGPTKRGKPLSEDSKDPNGSLIVGLKAQKEIVRTMAFWELLDLTKSDAVRRGTIFSEIDRVGGSTWSQVLGLCLKEIDDISTRIEAGAPTAPPKEAQEVEQPVIKTLPRLTPALKTDNILFPSPRSKSRQLAGEIVGSLIQEPRKTPTKPPTLAKANESLAPIVQTVSTIKDLTLRWPIIGAPFRTSMSRRAAFTLLSRPQSPNYLLSFIPFISPVPCTLSGASTIADAATTLGGLLEASLKEDGVGLVQKDVPKVVATLTKAILAIEKYIDGMKYWASDTEVLFIDDAKTRRRDEVAQMAKYDILHEGEIGEVFQALKAALTSVLGSFAEYAATVGLSDDALEQAKAALAAGESRHANHSPAGGRGLSSRPEMEQLNNKRQQIPKAPRFQPFTEEQRVERRVRTDATSLRSRTGR